MSITGSVDALADTAKAKMDDAIEHLKHELNNIRTGKANPALLEGLMVEVYGTHMHLRDVATIGAPEPRQLLISPYDAGNNSAIGKEIEKANLGFQVVVDANAIRIIVPPMDESLRKEMVKQCKKRCEEGKVSIRNIRRDCNEFLRKQKASHDVSEDIEKRMEKGVQELTEKYCKEIDEIGKKKETQIMEV